MKKRSVTIWVMVAVLCLGFSKADAAVLFQGGIHQVDWQINEWVVIEDSFQDRPATVNLLVGGSITDSVDVYEHSRLNVAGGLIGQGVRACNFSQVIMFDGIIQGQLNAQGPASQITVLGGAVVDHLSVIPDSHALIAGGTIGGMKANGGQITIVGADFKINGQSVGYGRFTNLDYPSGILTGTLANGDPMDTHFELYETAGGRRGSIFLASGPKHYPDCWGYTTQCHGDADGDSWKKGSDLLCLKESWFKCYPDPDYDPCADFDRDGCVNGSDFLILKNNWFKSGPRDCPPGDPYGIYQ